MTNPKIKHNGITYEVSSVMFHILQLKYRYGSTKLGDIIRVDTQYQDVSYFKIIDLSKFIGIRHRVDGPAIENHNGTKYWCYEGIITEVKSQEDFERYLKLRSFL